MNTTQKHNKEIFLPSYCYAPGSFYGSAAQQEWTKTDSRILIGALIALCGFCGFIIAFVQTF